MAGLHFQHYFNGHWSLFLFSCGVLRRKSSQTCCVEARYLSCLIIMICKLNVDEPLFKKKEEIEEGRN